MFPVPPGWEALLLEAAVLLWPVVFFFVSLIIISPLYCVIVIMPNPNDYLNSLIPDYAHLILMLQKHDIGVTRTLV